MNYSIWIYIIFYPLSVFARPITDFGARANDNVDDTDAIVAAIQFEKRSAGVVEIPNGRFIHRTFALEGVKMRGYGEGSILHAPDPADAIIYLRADHPEISSVNLTTLASSRVGGQDRVLIDFATNYRVEKLIIDGSNATGIYNCGGINGAILFNSISNTKADSIHSECSARNVVVAGNTITNSGDDGISVVSYRKHQLPVRNVLIENNSVRNQVQARGISVIGGEDITIRANVVENATFGAGIIVACEQSFDTLGARNILVADNRLSKVSGVIHHGGILVSAPNCPGVRQALFVNNSVLRSANEGIEVEGDVDDVFFDANKIQSSADLPFRIESLGNIGCLNNTVDGSPFNPPNCNGVKNYSVSGSSLVAPSVLDSLAPSAPQNLRISGP